MKNNKCDKVSGERSGKWHKALVSIIVAISCFPIAACSPETEYIMPQYLTGTAAPTAELGKNGDMYIDTDDYILYQKVEGEWTVVMRDFGKPVSPSLPDNIQLRAEGGYLQWKYASENDESWENLFALEQLKGADGVDGVDGADGIDGKTWLFGKEAPAEELGASGDIYLNTLSYDIYQKADGAGWTVIGNIKGKADVCDFYDRTLFLGDFVNKKVTMSTTRLTENDSELLTMESLISIPYEGCELKLTINDDYIAKIYTTTHYSKLEAESDWLENGAIFTAPAKHIMMKLTVRHKDSTGNDPVALSPEDIAVIEPVISYKTLCDTYADNKDAVRYIETLRGYFDSSATEPNVANKTKQQDKYAVITHLTDVHGDCTRLDNALTFSDKINADFSVFTGDITANSYTGYSSFISCMLAHKTESIVLTGNHDLIYLPRDASGDASIYNYMYSRLYDKYGITSETVNSQPSTWYYRDDAKHKVRIISLNIYERLGAKGNDSSPRVHINQRQVNFLINALNTTPEDYTCFIAYHSPENKLNEITPDDDTFYAHSWAYINVCNKDYTGTLISDIVDAYIEKTTLNKEYAQSNTYGLNGKTKTDKITVNADFTQAKGVFAAHMTGHFHQDSVCYLSGTKYKQLMLNSGCTSGQLGNVGGYNNYSDLCDMPRYDNGITQDCFNIYVVDTDKKEIHIVRVGSDMNCDMKERFYAKYSYDIVPNS